MGAVKTYFVAYAYDRHGHACLGQCVVDSVLVGRRLVDKVTSDLEEKLGREIVLTAFNEIPSE